MEMNFEDLPIPHFKEATASFERQASFIEAVRNFKGFETPRLHVRPVVLSSKETNPIESPDVRLLYHIFGPPEVHRWDYTVRNGFTLQDSLAWIEKAVAEKEAGLSMCLLSFDKKSGKLIGKLGGILDPPRLAATLAYTTVYGEDMQGRGYATEGACYYARALCGLGVNHLLVTIAPDNIPSQRVVSKLGIPQIEGATLMVKDQDGGIQPRSLYYISMGDWMKTEVSL